MNTIINKVLDPSLKNQSLGTGTWMSWIKAFTLVELIVVITILAVLWTIVFISLDGYAIYARDSVRLNNLRALETGLKIQYTQWWRYKIPDDTVNITASGTL